MTTNRQLTDTALEAALARYAGRVSADGLQAGIMADVAATEQARRPLFALPGWLDRPVAPGRLAAIPTVAWVLLLTGLLLGLVVGGLAGGLWRGPDRAVVVAPSPSASPVTPSPFATLAATPAPIGSMTRARTCHSATLLADGRVLLIGGDMGHRPNESTAELYDPQTGLFTPAGTMRSEDLACHSAITLRDGRVLTLGGADSFSGHWAETWDPATGAFTTVAGIPSDDIVAAGPLPAGRVLVLLPRGTKAELLDPVSGVYVETGSLAVGRDSESVTMLMDGRVLVAGGEPWLDGNDRASVGAWPTALEVYDSATGAFAAAGTLAAGRAGHTAILLADGRVLMVGGYSDLDGRVASDLAVPLASAETWDPATGTTSPTGSMTTARFGPTATLLADGRVLITGGVSDRGVAVASAEIWDPATGAFTPTGSMVQARRGHAAVRLRDGTVLVTGGTISTGAWLGDTALYLASAEIYDPTTGTFGPVGAP